MHQRIVFAGSPLDRVDHRRRDAGWIGERLREEATRVLPVWRLSVLVKDGAEPELAFATPALREALTEPAEPILLGVSGDEVAHFALDISVCAEPLVELEWKGVASFPELRSVAGQLPAGQAAIAAQARHMVDWHARHGYCGSCGARTRPRDAGHVRVCGDCGVEVFPRTDPVVIMLVVDGERCLLGRQPSWPRPFFSALAGFVEPGEALEEAVRREVREEVGVRAGRVRYLASQPWPFPGSLMIGCAAEALSTEVRVDSREIDEAAWFTRDQVAEALRAATPGLALPPAVAIAHQLLRAWVEGDAAP